MKEVPAEARSSQRSEALRDLRASARFPALLLLDDIVRVECFH